MKFWKKERMSGKMEILGNMKVLIRIYLAVFWPHLGITMWTVSVVETNDTIMGGVQCLSALL